MELWENVEKTKKRMLGSIWPQCSTLSLSCWSFSSWQLPLWKNLGWMWIVPRLQRRRKKKEPPFSEEYFDNTRHAFSLGHRRYLLEDVCMSKGHCIINLVVLVSVDHHNFEDDDGEDCGWLPLLKDYHSNTNNRTKTVILESAHHCFHRSVQQPSDSNYFQRQAQWKQFLKQD